MILKKIKLKNIRSYREAEITFPEGSLLLMGDIGSGKTSILLAIEFALFGLQPSQKGNSILRNNETEAQVTLELEVDEKRILIERNLKKSGKSVSQTDCRIKVNDEIYEGSVTEIKNKILSILNYPQEFAKKTNDLYKFTVYTPQEEMKQIILESNDIRLNTLRHIFGIDKYKRIEENLSLLTIKIRQDIRFKEAQILGAEQKKEQIKEKLNQIQREREILGIVEKELKDTELLRKNKQEEMKQINDKIEEKKRLENERDKSELTLNSKKNSLLEIEREIILIKEQLKVKAEIRFKEEDLAILKGKISENEKNYQNLNEDYVKTLSSMQNKEFQMNELRKLIEKISALEKCPTCLQVVTEEYKRNIVIKAKTDYDQINSENLKEKSKKEECIMKIDLARKSVENLKDSLSALQIAKIKLESLNEKERRLDFLEKQRASLSADISLIKSHILQLEETLKGYESYSIIFKQKEQELNLILIKEREVLIRKAEANRSIQIINIQIQEIEEEVKIIETISKEVSYLKELEFWLNSKFLELVLYTEKNVMLKLREEFSKLLSNWFSMLVSDTLSIRFDEAFSPIIQQTDYEIDYNYLSGGERTAVALAYRLALNQTINSLLSTIKTRDLVILDEPTDGFSESQLDKMRDIFNQLKVRQLIIVSHEQKIESFVDKIIHFKKIEGVTQIEKEM
jgi:exonuclease SbcC